MSVEIRNGVIHKVFLGLSDAGKVIASIEVDYGGCFQAFGVYEIYSENTKEDYTGRFLERCMEVAGSDSWSGMNGKPVRVKREDGLIKALGHYLKDDWYSPREEYLAKEGAV